jgi:LmbE family N-acetylglucosaminyl deacetylase
VNRIPGLGRLLVLSPHLDDGVFSCGELIAGHPGATVVTVFAGWPRDGGALTAWDEACGFHSGRAAMAARRAEDRAAAAVLRARTRWLAFLDAQYRSGRGEEAIDRRLGGVLRAIDPTTVLVPLGLFHGDHRLVHRAGLRLLRAEGPPRRLWLAYEDAIYRRIPGLLQRRLARLVRDGVLATPLPDVRRGPPARKRQAVRCYRSQLRGLATPGRRGHVDACAPERYWQLALR